MEAIIIYSILGLVFTGIYLLRYKLNVNGFRVRFKRRNRRKLVPMLILSSLGVFITWPFCVLFEILEFGNED